MPLGRLILLSFLLPTLYFDIIIDIINMLKEVQDPSIDQLSDRLFECYK
jgi:hypothetical protein